MRRPPLPWLALALLAAAGCRSRCDLVEAELRTKDRQLREMRAELMRAEVMNEALENTLKDQRCAGPPPGYPAVTRSTPAGQVKDIQLGRGTGGIDEDHAPGDEGLQVVLVPRDVDGSAIKAAGSLKVTVLEITPEGLKTPLSAWDVSALQLRRSWRAGLISTGYFVTLPWQRIPNTERLRVVAQFYPLEGCVFEAERDVTIHLLPEAQRGHGPLAPPAGLGPPVPAAPAPSGLAPPVPLEGGAPSLPPPQPITTPPTPGTGPMPGMPVNASKVMSSSASLFGPRPVSLPR